MLRFVCLKDLVNLWAKRGVINSSSVKFNFDIFLICLKILLESNEQQACKSCGYSFINVIVIYWKHLCSQKSGVPLPWLSLTLFYLEINCLLRIPIKVCAFVLPVAGVLDILMIDYLMVWFNFSFCNIICSQATDIPLVLDLNI